MEEYITATGTVNATHSVEMQSESAGYYKLAKNSETSKPFALGDFVKKGQVIIYLDNPEQENTIKIESQKLNLENTLREYEKQKSLYEKGGVTLYELKNSELSYVDAKYSYENALIQLSQLKITAPFDGIIADLPYYTEGVKVDSGSDMVYIVNYKKLNMEVNLPGKNLGNISANQSVKVMNYTMPDENLHGEVTQVSPVLDTETRTFKALIDIDNPDFILRPGMFVKVDIITASKDSTIVIPKNILISNRNRKSVFVVERGTAFERAVTVGLQNPDEVEITEGLKVNERLVISGFETLRDRSKIKIIQ